MTTQTGPPAPAQDVLEEAVRRCPYVGLMPFGEKDAEYFFGRKRDSDLIVANLTASRLTLLYAPSGVGKSSVLQAGVLPRLHRIAEETYEDLDIPGTAVTYVSNWRDAPLESIAAKISAAVSQVPGAEAAEQAAGAPGLSVAWLRELLRQSRVSSVYLIFDQFEEYLLYHPEDRGEVGLTAELGRILSDPDLPVNVLLSIREDAVASLDRFKGRVPRLFGNYLRLTHLSREEARTAIEGPLDRYNQVVPPERRMSIESRLTATLLDQVRTGQVRVAAEEAAAEGFTADRAGSDDRGGIETPFLQLVLTRLWDEERAAGSSCLRQSTLNSLGGAEKIVQSHLDNVMDELSQAQRDVVAAMFRDLVRPSGAKIALTAQDLADAAKRPVSAVQDLLNTLCAGPRRILRPLPPADGTVGHRYEIFHDVMGSAVLAWRRRYVTRQEQDEASGRLIAEREEAQVAARAARKRLRQTQLVALGVVVLLLFTSVMGYLLYRESNDAQQAQHLAQAAETIDRDPMKSLKSAVEAYGIHHNTHARSAVLTAASSPRSQVIAGPNPLMVGMVFTPDLRHVVAYGAHGSIRVISSNGFEEHKTEVVGPLRGTVAPWTWASAVNPDASRLALGTDRGAVAVVDTTTGRHVDIDTEAGSTPAALKWIGPAANGLVLVVSGAGVAATYSPETGKQIARFPGDAVDAVPLADEQHIVTSGLDGKLRVWDARTATKIAESSTLTGSAQFLSRYEQSVVGVIRNYHKSSIVVWDWRAGPDPTQYHFAYFNEISQVHVDEPARAIDIAWDKTHTRYSLVNGSRIEQLPVSTDWIYDVVGDSRWIITAGSDGHVMIWPMKFVENTPSRPTRDLSAHRGPVTQVGYVFDDRHVAVVISLGIDGTVRRWEPLQMSRFDQHHDWINDMDLSNNGSLLATAGSDGQAFIIDHRDLSKAVATVTTVGLAGVRFDPTDPHRVITLGEYGAAPELWRWGGGGDPEHVPIYATPQLPTSEYLVSLAISPNGLIVAAVDTQGTLHLWDARTGALRTDTYFAGLGELSSAAAFDPSSQQIAATGPDGVRVWRLGATEPLMLLPHPNATGVAFDPSDQQRLASTGPDGTVRIWTRDGKLDQSLVAHDNTGSNPSFSKDGNLLAVGTAEGLVEVWDVHSGVTLMRARHHSDSVSSVAFLPDDRSRLISASADSTVAQFACRACSDPDGVIREAKEWVEANPN